LLVLLCHITSIARNVGYCYRCSGAVGLSVCWSRSWAMQKWLKWLRCHLGADSSGHN